jgi:hypothetical protein
MVLPNTPLGVQHPRGDVVPPLANGGCHKVERPGPPLGRPLAREGGSRFEGVETLEGGRDSGSQIRSRPAKEPHCAVKPGRRRWPPTIAERDYRIWGMPKLRKFPSHRLVSQGSITGQSVNGQGEGANQIRGLGGGIGHPTRVWRFWESAGVPVASAVWHVPPVRPLAGGCRAPGGSRVEMARKERQLRLD